VGQGGVKIAGVPKHHRVDHLAQRAPLVLVTLSVALPEFAR
jgi:hypothetical protein